MRHPGASRHSTGRPEQCRAARTRHPQARLPDPQAPAAPMCQRDQDRGPGTSIPPGGPKGRGTVPEVAGAKQKGSSELRRGGRFRAVPGSERSPGHGQETPAPSKLPRPIGSSSRLPGLAAGSTGGQHRPTAPAGLTSGRELSPGIL